MTQEPETSVLPHRAKESKTKGMLDQSLRPLSTTGGPGHPFYNLVQLAKLLNVLLAYFVGY